MLLKLEDLHLPSVSSCNLSFRATELSNLTFLQREKMSIFAFFNTSCHKAKWGAHVFC